MTLFFFVAGAVFLAAGIIAFKKFPGIRMKYVWISLLIGVLSVLAGILLMFVLPSKGLLSEGDPAVTDNDDVSGKKEEAAEIPASPGTVVVEGNRIVINGETMPDIVSFDNYIASSDWQGGYELIDKYASYDAYIEVRRILEDRGKTVLSERDME